MKNIAYLICSVATLFAHLSDAQSQGIIADFRSQVKGCSGPAGPFVRAAFHEPGTYRITDGKGGNDGSLRLQAEIDAPQNRGLAEAIGILDALCKKHGISFADSVVVGGIVAIEECGGPMGMPITFGRIDTDTPNDPSRLPSARVTAQQIRDQFVTGMGFTVEETVALIGGSHTIAEVSSANSPGFTSGPMDSTSTVWDTKYLQELLTPSPPDGVVRIPADQNMANDPEMRAIIERFIKYPARFSHVFSGAYVKLLNLGAKYKKDYSVPVIPDLGQLPPPGVISIGNFATTLSFSISTPQFFVGGF